jgi:hypothetical protein
MLRAEIGVGLQDSFRRFEANAKTKRGNPTGSNQHQQKEESDKLSNSRQRDRAKANGVGIVTQRYLDRLKRDHEDLFERVNSGELKPYTAARLAGIVKDPTPEEKIYALDKKISVQARTRLCDVFLSRLPAPQIGDVLDSLFRRCSKRQLIAIRNAVEVFIEMKDDSEEKPDDRKT